MMDMKKARLTSLLLACAMLTACGSKTPEADGGNSAAETTTSPVMTVAVGTSEALPATTTAPAEEATEPVTTVPPDDMTRVHDISLTFYTTELKVGNKTMPYVTMSPETAVNKDEIWKSSDEKIATVDSLGNITGVSEGECTVTVTSADNPAVSAEVKVIVKAQEGLTYFDYKRLRMDFTLKYDGSNHPDNYQYNFDDGYVAPAMNFCITRGGEAQYNTAIINNPDPSGYEAAGK